MKQLLQNLRDGKSVVVDVPVPQVRPGTALVHTSVSLVSAGTERMVVEFASKGLLGKARSRPDLVKQLIGKARREGLVPALESAFNRLDQPMALGYSSAGTVIQVGPGLRGFQPGDRVACAGGGYAVHAEYAVVPQNLLAHLPPTVDGESGAFATLGAIALHGFRLARPQVGERVAVIGLGLLGMLTSGIASAAGCSVLGIDLDPQRVRLGEEMGIPCVLRQDAESRGAAITRGQGFDIILICADTPASDPVALAAALARDRANVVAIGSTGLELSRKAFYEKEINFIVSRSYGPGRYDQNYEEYGRDYPIGYVRWTEGRNLEAFVEMLASGRLDIHPLISHRYPIEDAAEAYRLICGDTKEPYLGVLLTYPHAESSVPSSHIQFEQPATGPVKGELSLGVLGAGNYARAVFLPNVRKVGRVKLAGVVSASGVNAQSEARRYGFSYATSSEEELLQDPQVNLVAILDRHQHHARQVIAALEAGKHVYCEKPLAVLPRELDGIIATLKGEDMPILAVGFNRRFSRLSNSLKEFLHDCGEPLYVDYLVNAGYLPLTHWLHDPAQGGGRIIGEGCHFIDYITFLVGTPPVSVAASALPDGDRYSQDNVSITLRFPDGSIGHVAYLANGDRNFPKERIEVFSAGSVAVLDDFRSLEMVYDGRRRVIRSPGGQDKGHMRAWEAFLDAVSSGAEPPIPYDQLIGVTWASFAAVQALSSGKEETIA